MKTFLKIISLSLATAMLFSCSADIVDPESPEEEGGKEEEVAEEKTHVVPENETDPSIIDEITVPTLKITARSVIEKDIYKEASIVISDPDATYSDTTLVECGMQIRGRGNTTWGMDKKPYRIKLDTPHKVLGMPSNRDWILLANYSDKSLMRNSTAMLCSRILGLQWSPRHRTVELWLNGEYQGVYDLFESKEVTKNKVNIDIENGDAYLEIESSTDEPYHFSTSVYGVPIQFKEPETPDPICQMNVKNAFKSFETALKSSYFDNPQTGYARYIDVDSFVNFYILEEIAKNVDGNTRKSSFMTYEKSTGKLKFVNVWDFDISFGNCNYISQYAPDMTGCGGDPNGPTGWWIKDYGPSFGRGQGWFPRLFQDPEFVKKVQDRWTEVYPQLWQVPDFIYKWETEMGDAPARNFGKWQILGHHVWPNIVAKSTYHGEVEYLRNWYYKRIDWMNTELFKL